MFGQFPAYKIVYKAARAHFPQLASQVVIRCEAKVAQAYALDRKTQRSFRPFGAIEYDARILTWHVAERWVSIWTVSGRLNLTFAAGTRQLELLQGALGQADLSLVEDDFYLSVACQVEEPEPQISQDVLGCDLGIINLLADSDGETFAGDQVETQRRRMAQRRRNLQRRHTRRSERKLRQLSGKQARFQTDTNHCISKYLVNKAQGTGRAIALEDLTGIRDRVTIRRQQRARQANWAFFQLRAFIEYKARLAGVEVIPVDPRNTSRTCPECGCIEPANRQTQSLFLCVSCGYSAPADHNAARNIRARTIVNWPNEHLLKVSTPLA